MRARLDATVCGATTDSVPSIQSRSTSDFRHGYSEPYESARNEPSTRLRRLRSSYPCIGDSCSSPRMAGSSTSERPRTGAPPQDVGGVDVSTRYIRRVCRVRRTGQVACLPAVTAVTSASARLRRRSGRAGADRVKAVRDQAFGPLAGTDGSPILGSAADACPESGRPHVAATQSSDGRQRVGRHESEGSRPGQAQCAPRRRRPRRAAAPPSDASSTTRAPGYHGLHRWLPSWRVIVGTILGVGFLGAGAVVAAYASTTIPDAGRRHQGADVDRLLRQQRRRHARRGHGHLRDAEAHDRRLRHAARSTSASRSPPPRTRRSSPTTAASRSPAWAARCSTTCAAARPRVARPSRSSTSSGTTSTRRRRTTSASSRRRCWRSRSPRRSPRPRSWSGYLNTIYFGRDSYGIQAAAQAYFGVDAADLTVEQAALLAGIIPSPNNWDPARSARRRPRRAGTSCSTRWRRRAGSTAAERAPRWCSRRRSSTCRATTMRGTNGLPARDGRRRAGRQPPYEITDDELNRGGYSVVTTIQQPLQDDAVDQVNGVHGRHARGPERRRRPGRAHVRAVHHVGRPEERRDRRAVRRPRLPHRRARTARPTTTIQAGSTFKPFALIAALEQGIPLTTKFDGHSPQDDPGWDPVGKTGAATSSDEPVRHDRPRRGDRRVGEHRLRAAQHAGRRRQRRPRSPSSAGVGDAGRRRQPGQRARHRRRPPARHGRRLRDDRARAASATTRTSSRTVNEPRRHGRVRAQGRRHEPAFAADVIADTTYAMQQVVRVGLRQGLGQAARPTDRRQDRDVEREQVGLVHRLHAEHRHRGVAEPASARTARRMDTITPFGKTKGGRTLKEVTGGTWPAFLWESYMKHVFAHAAYARRACSSRPARTWVARPTPTAAPRRRETVAPTPAPTEQAPDAGRRPGRARGQARGATRPRPSSTPVSSPTIVVGAVRHGDGRAG